MLDGMGRDSHRLTEPSQEGHSVAQIEHAGQRTCTRGVTMLEMLSRPCRVALPVAVAGGMSMSIQWLLHRQEMH